jgi:hypothetical protein
MALSCGMAWEYASSGGRDSAEDSAKMEYNHLQYPICTRRISNQSMSRLSTPLPMQSTLVHTQIEGIFLILIISMDKVKLLTFFFFFRVWGLFIVWPLKVVYWLVVTVSPFGVAEKNIYSNRFIRNHFVYNTADYRYFTPTTGRKEPRSICYMIMNPKDTYTYLTWCTTTLTLDNSILLALFVPDIGETCSVSFLAHTPDTMIHISHTTKSSCTRAYSVMDAHAAFFKN